MSTSTGRGRACGESDRSRVSSATLLVPSITLLPIGSLLLGLPLERHDFG